MRLNACPYEYLRGVPQTPADVAQEMMEGPRGTREDEITAFIYEKAKKIREARGTLTPEQVKQIDKEQEDG